MSRTAKALEALAGTVGRLCEEASRLAEAQAETARQQRITNLIVRSQVETDPAERDRLIAEARRRMDQPSRRDRRA